MNLTAWLRSKSWSSHTIAAALVALACIIAADPQAQQFITALFKSHAEAASEIILLAGLVAKYSHSSSPAGTMATARIIADKPDAPTASEVERASTK